MIKLHLLKFKIQLPICYCVKLIRKIALYGTKCYCKVLVGRNMNKDHSLTSREKIILKLVAKGCTNKQIAERLFISIDTVKKHLQNSYRKLNAGNKIEALRKAGIM